MRNLVLSIFLIFMLGLIQNVYSQENTISVDSVMVFQPGMDTTGFSKLIDSVYIDETTLNRPKIAAFYSAALPGLGQIYNRSYWKLPIIFGGFATMGYFIDYNNKKYQQFRNAYLEKVSYPEDEWQDPLTLGLSKDNLQRGIDYYRRNRDLLMVLLVGVYFIQVLDAHIEAHLMEFDISEDLSLNLSPNYQPPGYMTAQEMGLKLTLNIN